MHTITQSLDNLKQSGSLAVYRWETVKKAGAISLAAFYLLLTTGLYLCILHCTSEYFFEKQPMVGMHEEKAGHSEKKGGHHEKPDKHADKKKCDGENCDCCKKHGTYVVNENVRTPSQVIPVEAFAIAVLLGAYLPYHSSIERDQIAWPNSHGPPIPAKQPLYLSNRTLLI